MGNEQRCSPHYIVMNAYRIYTTMGDGQWAMCFGFDCLIQHRTHGYLIHVGGMWILNELVYSTEKFSRLNTFNM